jgi:DNA-binding NarL/FixJ family response regulator
VLTPHEIEVLRLIATGESTSAIATQLVISQGTVKSDVKNILRKLHATNRTTAVARYYQLTNR